MKRERMTSLRRSFAKFLYISGPFVSILGTVWAEGGGDSIKNDSHKTAMGGGGGGEEEYKCGLYLAQSSIRNAGYGIYTTRAIENEKELQPYREAPTLLVHDFYELFGNNDEDWNHSNYIWEALGRAAHEADELSENSLTFGSLTNYHVVSASGCVV